MFYCIRSVARFNCGSTCALTAYQHALAKLFLRHTYILTWPPFDSSVIRMNAAQALLESMTVLYTMH